MQTEIADATGAQSAEQNQPDVRARELKEARDMLTACVLGLKHGGASARFGKLIKSAFGLKFDSFKPTDLADILEQPHFARRVSQELEKWITEASAEVSEGTKKAREREIAAVSAFIADSGHQRLAAAIRTIREHRADVWGEDSQNNTFPNSLSSACHMFLGLNLTAARRMKMKVRF